MGCSRFDPAMHGRPAWNAGKNVSTKRPLTQKQIWAIRFFLDREGRLRDRALFDLAINSKLRGRDFVKTKIGDVVAVSEMRNRATVIQQKTHRPVQFELTADVPASLLSWLERRGGSLTDFLFPSRVDHTGHLSTRQYALGRRMGHRDIPAQGRVRHSFPAPNQGRHDLRATRNIRVIQILLGHTKIENTVRYLRVDVRMHRCSRNELKSHFHAADRVGRSTDFGVLLTGGFSPAISLSSVTETPLDRHRKEPCALPSLVRVPE